MVDYSKYVKEFSSMLAGTLVGLVENDIEKLMTNEESRKSIEDFLYLTSKLEELKYRLNPSYSLSIANPKNEEKAYILAKVKWPYLFKGKLKSPPYINVHVGTLKKYPLGLQDPNLLYEVPSIIQSYLRKISPIELKKENGDIYFIK